MVTKELKHVMLLDILEEKLGKIVVLNSGKFGYTELCYGDIFGNECFSLARPLTDEEFEYYKFIDECYVTSKCRNEIKITNVFESNFNENEYIVEYKYKNFTGYEIMKEQEEIRALQIIFNSDKYFNKLVSKYKLDECSKYFKELIKESLNVDGEMLFIEEYQSVYLKRRKIIKNEIHRMNLDKFIKFNNEDGILITVYRDIITQFLF